MIRINLEKYQIKEEDTLVVGCSAGPDSMALLHYLKNNTNNPIICAHINHNIRKESKEEEKYLKNYCKKENIIFETITIEKYKEKNLENEARTLRYKFYEKILEKYHTPYLFLAHHGDDLIETILMKIARGSNLEGYAGIKEIAKKENYYIIRPFLEYTKLDLINYNNQHNITYYLDKTNEDTTYTRNRYRKNILPLLKEENSNIHKQYLKYSKTLLEYQTYIEEEISTHLPKIFSNDTIELTELKKIHPFLQKNIIYKILNTYYQNEPNLIKEKNMQDLLNLIENKKPNLSINLPQNKIARKSYDKLYLEEKNTPPENYKIPLQKINQIGTITIKQIEDTTEDGNDICRLNSKKLNLPLYLRNRQPGDTIEQKGLNGHKKIKEIFIENKIPKHLRDTYPILVDNKDQIIWIPNIKKSKFNSQKQDFYDIILKYCEKEENNE